MLQKNIDMTIRQRLILGFFSISAILVTAVFSTLVQVASIDKITENIVEVRMPSADSSSRMVNHINASLASLRGWLLTQNTKFKHDLTVIWDEIYHTQAKMDALSMHWKGKQSQEKWSRAKQLLHKFEKIQQRVESMGHTLEEKPANKILILQATPEIDKMFSSISRMINIEKYYISDAVKQEFTAVRDRAVFLSVMADFRGSLAFAVAKIRAYLLTGEKKYQQSFFKQWSINSDRYKKLENSQYLMIENQKKAFLKLVESRKIFNPLPEKMFVIRASDKWNMSNYLLVNEAVPVANKLLALLAGEKNSQGIREGGLANIELQLLVSHANNNVKNISRLMALQWFLLIVGLIIAIIIAIGTANSITIPLAWITDALSSIASGSANIQIKGTEQCGEIGALARSAQVFQQVALKMEETNWKKTQIAIISSKTQQTKLLNEFCRTTIDLVTPLVKGVVSAFYIYQSEQKLIQLEASYGFNKGKYHPSQFQLREGIIGQVAYEKKSLILSPIPDNFIRIDSALGRSIANVLIVLPIVYQDRLLGVIEIASFEILSQLSSEFLDEMLPTLALNLENLNQVLHAKALLEETKRQAAELRSSEEEIRASAEELKCSEEELRVSNEELLENTKNLQQKTQALELSESKQREINEQLSERNIKMENQQQKLQEALDENTRKTAEIEQSSRYKSEFLANMSHELRTPLNSLLILSKMLAENEDDNLTADNVEAAEIIHESGSLLLKRINEILDLSKVEAGKMPVNLTLASVSDISHGIKRSFEHVAEEKGIDFSVVMGENLPKKITTDVDKLVQILDNLIANALKFTTQGSVSLSFLLPSKLPKNMDSDSSHVIQFAIKDTGIGIEKEQMDTIFEAFRQADSSTSRKYGGTGLGLSISKKLATLLGGVISVESQQGQGATFSLYLPIEAKTEDGISSTVLQNTEFDRAETVALDKDETEDLNQVDDLNELEGVITENRKLEDLDHFIEDDRNTISTADKFILVVEDDPIFAKILLKRIHKNKLKAIVTDKPEDGLLLAKLLQPMGIILDIELPGMDGIELYEQLQKRAKTDNIPVHFMTASDAQQRVMKIGNAGYFSKPVTSEQIDETLDYFSVKNLKDVQSILIVDGDTRSRLAIARQMTKKKGIKIYESCTGMGAIEQLQKHPIDCMILDLALPDMDGVELLKQLDEATDIDLPQTIIYSARELSDEEMLFLRQFTDSLILKGGYSGTRLEDEVMLFLHSVEQNKSTQEKNIKLHSNPSKLSSPGQEAALKGKTVLVVDDDIRNTFVLSRALRGKGMKVLMARDGEIALKLMKENETVNIILMDTMMPGIDGYETTRRIRKNPKFKNIPILTVTAKAMKEDKQRSLEVGATDYLCKPIDMDKLLSMMRVWL